MVRNTVGGSKTKSFARKNFYPSSHIPTPHPPYEFYAHVSKLFGNSMCQIITHSSPSLTLTCHIRGKFRARKKKHNLLILNSNIIIGVRTWENPYKNCDLIAVLDTFEDSAIATSAGGGSSTGNALDNFAFSNDEIHEQDPEDLMPGSTTATTATIGNDLDEDFDIDDI